VPDEGVIVTHEESQSSLHAFVLESIVIDCSSPEYGKLSGLDDTVSVMGISRVVSKHPVNDRTGKSNTEIVFDTIHDSFRDNNIRFIGKIIMN